MMEQGNEYIINSDGDVVRNNNAYDVDSQEAISNMDDSRDAALESKNDKKPKKSILKKNDLGDRRS